MSREYRIFEVDKYGNKFFACRHSTEMSANYWLKKVAPKLDEGAKYQIENEVGEVI